jgi:ferrous iron transport protein B
VVSIPIAWLLKRTAFAGPRSVFLLELPTYKLPSTRVILQRMLSSARSFVVRAGTVILAVNLVVWALAYFPHDPRVEQGVRTTAAAEGWEDSHTEEEVAGAYLRESYLGRMGRAIEPAVRPLGWDWRIGMAVIASFPAREVVIGTLSTIFNVGAEEDEAAPRLRDALTQAKWPESGRPIFTVPVALSLMVFFALCAQCSSTLVVMGREMRSWVWPVISFVGMTGLAYVGALVTVWLARVLS